MERLLSRKQVLDDENDDMVEVDKISFTSFASSDDGDLRMSVQQSPIPSSFSDFKSASELSLHCQHRRESGCAEVLAETGTTGCEDFCYFQDEWIKNLYIHSDLPPLPEIVPKEPYWKALEEELIGLRQRDATVSRDLEETNMYLYSLRIALGAMEEARWLNDVSKDPELSRLAHEIDPRFPLAVHHIPASLESCGSSVSDAFLECGDFLAEPPCSPFDICDATSKPVFSKATRRSIRRPRAMDAVSPSRKPGITWSELSSITLER
ncbi:unnamed protein product [Heligmosomoides polygyrus]|uniref:Protein kibra n=1 Tax=Heligmosomoides polygyrus TaxID=6339 RepID=A0A183F3J6_HELPZ|nr:unnamed protein product [Heligmosomoides polygyrus]